MLKIERLTLHGNLLENIAIFLPAIATLKLIHLGYRDFMTKIALKHRPRQR
jgi:hypothetical protein